MAGLSRVHGMVRSCHAPLQTRSSSRWGSGGSLTPTSWPGQTEALGRKLAEQLALDKVNLPQIGFCWIMGDARPMLHRGTAMSITSDAKALEQGDLFSRRLGERMRCA